MPAGDHYTSHLVTWLCLQRKSDNQSDNLIVLLSKHLCTYEVSCEIDNTETLCAAIREN